MIINKISDFFSVGKFIFLLISIILFSCSDNAVLNEYKDFESGYWAYNTPATFEFSIADTSVDYSIDYHVRNSMDYEFYNLYVTYSLEKANGDTVRSSMHEANLVDPTTGKPLGSTAGDYYDHTIPLFQSLHFSDTGRYQFTLKQYMRRDTLEHIHAVGLRVSPENTGS